jgi:hypothetical protein
MAVSRAQSIGPVLFNDHDACGDAVWSLMCPNMTEKLWVIWEKIHQLVVDSDLCDRETNPRHAHNGDDESE